MAAVTTLPAAFTVGQILTSTQMNDLRGAFRVLQVVNAQYTTSTTTTSSSYVTTGATATITPSSTSSKILVIASTTIQNSGSGTAVAATMFRGTVAGTNLATGATVAAGGYAYSAGGLVISTPSMSFLDSPATASAQIYTLGFKTGNGTVTATAQVDTTSALITLMEISA
jgi:hypothetical protein